MNSQIWKSEINFGPQEFEFCGGKLVIFSRRSPEKETENEDSAAMIQWGEQHGLLVVADGMGGHASGNRASAAVVETVTELCQTFESGSDSARSTIVDAIELSNRRILDWSIGAGSTAVVVEFQDDKIRFIHVGDSSGLLFSNRGNIKHYTIAHAPVAQAVELGIIDEESALVHGDRNLIDNFVGDSEMRVDVGPEILMAKRDTLVIASDGLFDNLLHAEVVNHLRAGNLLRQTEQLVQEVQARMVGQTDFAGKPDDCTIICFRRK